MSVQLPPQIDDHQFLSPGELAALIAEYGITRFESEVETASDMAESNGAPQRLARLTRDRLTPDVVRERAFGRLAAYLPIR